MTPVVQLASAASADLARMRPSPAISSARVRAGVMRGGTGAPATIDTPNRGRTGSNASLALIIMRTTMPSGDKRVFGDPLGKAQRGGRERRHVQSLHHGLQFFGVDRLVALADGLVPDDADAALRAQGHQHEAAGLQLQVLRHQVIVGLVEGDGQQNGHSPARGRLRTPHFVEQTIQSYRRRIRSFERILPA